MCTIYVCLVLLKSTGKGITSAGTAVVEYLDITL